MPPPSNPESGAGQRERATEAQSDLREKTDESLASAQQALDALSAAAQEGTQTLAELNVAAHKVVFSAIEERLGALGRWHDQKLAEVDAVATQAGRFLIAVGGAYVGLEAQQRSRDYQAQGYREAGAVIQDALGVTAIQEELVATQEELAATRRSLEQQAQTAGDTAATEAVTAGVEAGAETLTGKIVISQNGVNVRSTPSISGNKIQTLPKGATVDYEGEVSTQGGYVWRKIAGAETKWVASGTIKNPYAFLA